LWNMGLQDTPHTTTTRCVANTGTPQESSRIKISWKIHRLCKKLAKEIHVTSVRSTGRVWVQMQRERTEHWRANGGQVGKSGTSWGQE
jgi:hypothetical protein